ncbi:MAG: hypothetical protein ABSB10_04420 [Candidatus Bathyarchaeia archaeon]
MIPGSNPGDRTIFAFGLTLNRVILTDRVCRERWVRVASREMNDVRLGYGRNIFIEIRRMETNKEKNIRGSTEYICLGWRIQLSKSNASSLPQKRTFIGLCGCYIV